MMYRKRLEQVATNTSSYAYSFECSSFILNPFWFAVPQGEFIEKFSNSVFELIDTMNRLARFRNSLVYESKVFKKFAKQTGLSFDVIVAEEFYQESFLMLAHKYKAPIVAICK